MTYHSDALHQITLHTNNQKPHLTGEIRAFVEVAVRNLPVRYPGLKVVHSTIHPDRVELLLDFHRLDEDVTRVLQSFKSEVRNLSKRKGFSENHLWQWNYEEKMIGPQGYAE